MGKITHEYVTKYEVGDVVVFEKHDLLQVGIIEGYYVSDNIFWFNIRISGTQVYTYSNGGDVQEESIIGVLTGEMREKCLWQIGVSRK